MKKEDLQHLNQKDFSNLERLEEGDTFGIKDKKKRFEKKSLNFKASEDILTNSFDTTNLEKL